MYFNSDSYTVHRGFSATWKKIRTSRKITLPKKYTNNQNRKEYKTLMVTTKNAPDWTSAFLAPGTINWVPGPRLPVGMVGPCAAPISAHSFLIVHRRHVLEFDVRVDGPTSFAGWREQWKWPQLQVVRTNQPGCAVLKTKFIVAGGHNDNDGNLRSTEIIDLERKTIHFAGGMHKPRAYFHLFAINGNVYAVGGNNYDALTTMTSNNLVNVEVFVEDEETWKPADKDLPGGRDSYGGVAIDQDFVCG